MIECVDGLMGSGKTYYAVDRILKSEHDKIFTNIEGFKFGNKIEQYKITEFQTNISLLHALYMSKKDDEEVDEFLIQKMVELGILDNITSITLLVVDEAHNQFDKKNDSITWLFTYHRHLNLDIILITQTYSLIHYTYFKLFQKFIHAIPQDRMLFKNKFKYQHHITVPFYSANTLEKTEYLKLDKQIFNAYKSGDKVRSTSVVRKYFIYVALGLSMAVVSFYYLLNIYFYHDEKDDSQLVTTTTTQTPQNSNSSKIENIPAVASDSFNISDSAVYTLRYWHDYDYLTLEGVEFPKQIFKVFKEHIPLVLSDSNDSFCRIVVFYGQKLFFDKILDRDSEQKALDSVLNPFKD